MADMWDMAHVSRRVLRCSRSALGTAAVCCVLASPFDALAQAVQPGQMPTLPLTQLDERGLAVDLDNRVFTLTFAQPVSITDLMLLLVRGTNLSIVPEPTVDSSFIGELKNVTVRQALGLILQPLSLDYAVDGTFIRVFRREPETRLFDVNLIATERIGSSTIGGGEEPVRSRATVSSSTRTDPFADLSKGVKALLSDRATFNIDRKAGLLQVTDFPERLERVEQYLDAVQDRIHRQAQIDVRFIEIELTDDKAPGVDWTAVASQLVGEQAPATRAARPPALTGLRVGDMSRLLTVLASQGKVTTVANPRLVTLNNEPAILRTDAFTFSVTPQIAGDGVLTLALSPIVKMPAIVESDLIARILDGDTLVIWGFTRDREVRERKTVGITGGWFGRGTVLTRKRVELVILLTAKIVTGVGAS